MTSRGRPARRGRAAPRRPPRPRIGPGDGDLVIVSRALADLAEFLQSRQAAARRGRVILDRRVGDRRIGSVAVERDRRRRDRRQVGPGGAEALMRVLGFSVVPSAVGSDGAAPGPAKRRPPRVGSPRVRSRRVAPARRSRRPRR